MNYDDTAAALFAAVEPVAAYCERTARPNRHADELDHLINAVADFGAAADAALTPPEAGPDWQAVAYRLLPYLPLPPYVPSPLELRCRALLDSPRARRVAALPPEQRAALQALTSYDLPLPDSL